MTQPETGLEYLGIVRNRVYTTKIGGKSLGNGLIQLDFLDVSSLYMV
ncbi:hypothetical protein P4V56_31590 [Brevibacillus porteri]|nr:hypothetical protein [Brevibacillus porteri]